MSARVTNLSAVLGDSARVADYLNQQIANFKLAQPAAQVEKLEASVDNQDQILAALANTDLFASHKLVIVRSFADLSLGEALLEQVVNSVPDTNQVILDLGGIDKRSKNYLQLKKLIKIEDLKSLDKRQMLEWVQEFVKNNGQQISYQQANYLVDRVGQNQSAIKQALGKLIAVEAYDQQTVDRLVDQSLESNVFELLDKAFSAQSENALAVYDQLRAQKEQPQKILAMFIWQMQSVMLAKTSKNLSSDAQIAGIKGYSLSKAQQIASKISYQNLLAVVQALSRAEAGLKRTGQQPDQTLKTLIVEISVLAK